MSKQREITVDLDRFERIATSYYGNPTFKVWTTDGEWFRTATDTSCAYGLSNWWSRGVDRRQVTLVLEGAADKGRGRIVDIYRDEPNGRYRA